MDKKYQIFVSSTYADLVEERQAIFKAILMLDEIPAGMESFVSFPGDQIKYIERLIDRCDYIVIIVKANYGSSRTKSGISYTEHEYEYAKLSNKKIMVFINDSREGLQDDALSDILNQNSSITKFKNKLKSENQVAFWTTPEGLATVVSGSISRARLIDPAEGWIRGSERLQIEERLNSILAEKTELERTVSILKSGKDQVAHLSDELQTKFSLQIEQADESMTQKVGIVIKWIDLFKLLADAVHENRKDFRSGRTISDYCLTDSSYLSKKIGENILEARGLKTSDRSSCRVSSESFDDIYFKFLDSNLIEDSTFLGYHLTELGKKLYAHLRAINIPNLSLADGSISSFQNSQWKANEDGLVSIAPKAPYEYFIEASRLNEPHVQNGEDLYSWPLHMARKTWIDIDDFLEAFDHAIRLQSALSNIIFDDKILAKTCLLARNLNAQLNAHRKSDD
ncbi:hypothetical protein HNR00_002210 [Methylorubrum rhodinum]|uniref:DUF4062 domain-containing protein n=1 Tax=Methylorubrum rhodinum TaxID=29428 RepID=A0A840ZKM5_9HYPH|nr:DUF4062 domain-containing protein [Methylorubrum rhodinum]MBB5757497.1 hypothetical protein [Methylorubrum rhodinum]